MTNTAHHRRYLDAIIEYGVLFLLIFPPLAVGAVQQWSVAVMALAAFLIFIAWLLKPAFAPLPPLPGNRSALRPPDFWIFLFPLVLAGIALLQLVPLPPRLLQFLSPETSSFYQAFSDAAPGAWRTLSLYPQATADALLKMLSYGAVFAVIVSHYDTPKRIKRLFGTIVIMGCGLALFGALQTALWNGKLYWVLQLREGLKPFGPFINKNHFAGYMEMAAPLGLGFYLYTVSEMSALTDRGMHFKERLAVFFDKKNLPALSFGLTSVLLLSGALFMTLSRGAITGFAISMLALIGLIRSRRSLRKGGFFMTLAGLILVFSVVLSGWSMVEKRFDEAGQGETTRLDLWNDAGALVRDYPLLGTGLGTFKQAFLPYQTKYPRTIFEHAENEYIELAAEAGVCGLVIALIGIPVFYVSLLRQWKSRHNNLVVSLAGGAIASCVAITVHGFFDFNMRIPANAMLMTIIAAGAWAAVFKVRSSRIARVVAGPSA